MREDSLSLDLDLDLASAVLRHLMIGRGDLLETSSLSPRRRITSIVIFFPPILPLWYSLSDRVDQCGSRA